MHIPAYEPGYVPRAYRLLKEKRVYKYRHLADVTVISYKPYTTGLTLNLLDM